MQLKALIVASIVPAAVVYGLPVERRDNVFDDLWDLITGDVGTLMDKSMFPVVVINAPFKPTQPGASPVNQGVLGAQATSQLSSILRNVPTGVGAAVVTGPSGIPQVELTSINGPVITLANGPGGVTTTFAGQTYTIVTATAPASSTASSSFASSTGSVSASASTTSSPFASSTSSSSTSSDSSASTTSSSATSTASASNSTDSASSTSSSSSSTHSVDPKNFAASDNKKDNGATGFIVPLMSVVVGIVTGGLLVL